MTTIRSQINTPSEPLTIAELRAVKNISTMTAGIPHSRKSLLGKLAVLALAITLVGCQSQIKRLPDSAQVDVPNNWEVEILENSQDSEDSTQSDNGINVVTTDPVSNGWLSVFNDNELIIHTQRALHNNPDLIGSASQLKSTIEQAAIAGAQLWPQAQLNYSDNDTEVTGPAGGVSTVNGVAVDSGQADGEGSITTQVSTISATLDISWEADIWGKLTQRKKSSALSAKSQAETFKAAEFSLVANVSRSWYNMITNRLQAELAQQRLDSFDRTATLIDENYKRGLRSALDVYLSRTDVQVQISNLEDAKFNYLQSQRTFKTLLGDYPNSNLEVKADLPVITKAVPAGLPADLLTRRPDIKAANSRMKLK